VKEFKYDDNISIPKELSEYVQRGVNDAKRPNGYSRNKPKIIISLMLLCIITVVFNPQTRAFTVELPIVEDVMKWFKLDGNIKQIKANKLNVYDLVTEKDGYKLYMKDIYFDEEKIFMKIAVEDESGQAFDIQGWEITSNHSGSETRKIKGVTVKNVDPWYNIWVYSYLKSMFDEHNYYYGKAQIKFNINVSDGNKIICFNEVEINEEKVSEARTKVYKLNKEYELDGIKIFIEYLKVYPNRMEVRLRHKTDDIDSKLTYVKMKLTDKNGKVYEKSRSGYYSRRSKEFQFNESIYFDEDNSIKKIDIEFGHGKVESMNIMEMKYLNHEEAQEFNYNNSVFKAYIEKDKNNREYTYLNTKINEIEQIFSMYYIRKWTGAWERMWRYNPTQETTIRITKNEIDMELGMDLEDILKLNDDEFYNYAVKYSQYIDSRQDKNEKTVNSKIDIDLIKKSMKGYIEEGEIYTGGSISIGDIETFRSEKDINNEDCEFGILDESKIKTEHIEIELD